MLYIIYKLLLSNIVLIFFLITFLKSINNKNNISYVENIYFKKIFLYCFGYKYKNQIKYSISGLETLIYCNIYLLIAYFTWNIISQNMISDGKFKNTFLLLIYYILSIFILIIWGYIHNIIVYKAKNNRLIKNLFIENKYMILSNHSYRNNFLNILLLSNMPALCSIITIFIFKF